MRPPDGIILKNSDDILWDEENSVHWVQRSQFRPNFLYTTEAAEFKLVCAVRIRPIYFWNVLVYICDQFTHSQVKNTFDKGFLEINFKNYIDLLMIISFNYLIHDIFTFINNDEQFFIAER